MTTITFDATIGEDQVIRLPESFRLPSGEVEVTIRPGRHADQPSISAANARLRTSRVRTGTATGIDNEAIDADLVRADGSESP